MSVGTGMVTLDDFTWTAPGTMTLPGGTRRRVGYDGLLRVTSINATSPADALIQNYSYTYDDAGNIRKKDTEHGAYAYSYDKLDRLIGSDNPHLSDESFTYDAVGNRLSSAAVNGSWLYNENNELLQAGNRAEYKYDAAGNLIEKKTAKKTLTFSYDLDNRLSEVHADGVLIARYVYDPFGRRIWKEVRGSRTYFHYSDSGLVAEINSNGNIQKSYGYRPDSPWGTDPLFVRENGKNYWFLNDHLGTPQQIVAENGGVVWKAQYQVFGKAEVDSSSSVTNNLRFPGQYHDEETGLYYNWNRYYDPESGRYTQVDPIGFEGGINIYIYSINNTLMFTDPYGLKVYLCCREIQVSPFLDKIAKSCGYRHCFIRTYSKEAGMGPANNGPLPAWPLGIPTSINNHNGQSINSICEEVKDVDESCVNRELAIGKSTGDWSPSNNCNTVANNILNKCKKKGADLCTGIIFDNREPGPIPGPIYPWGADGPIQTPIHTE